MSLLSAPLIVQRQRNFGVVMSALGEADVPNSEANLGKPVLAQIPPYGQRRAIFSALSGSYRTFER